MFFPDTLKLRSVIHRNHSQTRYCLSILVSNEPKTYATLVKSGGTGVGMGSLGSAVSNPNVPAKPTTSPVS
jgi:hypothetical protein